MKTKDIYKIHANKDTSALIVLKSIICNYNFTGSIIKNELGTVLKAHSDLAINLKDFLNEILKKYQLSLEIPDAFNIVIDSLEVVVNYNLLSFKCQFSGLFNLGSFEYSLLTKEYFLSFSLNNLDLKNIPLLNEFTSSSNFSINDITLVNTTKQLKYKELDIEKGLSLYGSICGKSFVFLIKTYNKFNNSLSNDDKKILFIDINKKISKITLHRVGIMYEKNNIGFMLDITLALSMFQFSVLGAGLSVNLSDKSLSFSITGIALEFDNGFLTIGGAFNKVNNKFTGGVTIGIKSFKINFIGDYENNHLLVYTLVNANIGGPPAFFITGLSGAFGYNKAIVLPKINEVSTFPLVKAAIGKSDYPLARLITDLDKKLINKEGDKFISLGIKFTSFNLFESFILLNVSLQENVTINIFGISTVSIPPLTNKQPIALASLQILASIDPTKGQLEAKAELTSESFIFDKRCKLYGGFCFNMWFGDNEHSGDFVVSLGGYHPSYKRPSHYPLVPRLGFNWQISSKLTFKGESYFALTPSCLMAGIRMDATFKDGNLKAWFIASCDFIISWKPFWYEARVKISLGASYTCNFLFFSKTFTTELSADVNIWGPNFAGRARITWYIISFTIEFGDLSAKWPGNLSYEEFSKSFLPTKKVGENDIISPLTIIVTSNIIKEQNGLKYLDPSRIAFLVSSAVPISDGSIQIVPMGHLHYTSEINITTGFDNPTFTEDKQRLPQALWGGTSELREVITGYSINSKESTFTTFPVNRFISLDELYELNTRYIKAYKFIEATKVSYTTKDSIKVFMETIDKVNDKRVEYLKNMDITDIEDISLTLYSLNANELFDEDILLQI